MPSSTGESELYPRTRSKTVIHRDLDLDLEGGEGKPLTTEIKVTNEDISKVIALLDDAKLLCFKTQNEFSPLKVCVKAPRP